MNPTIQKAATWPVLFLLGLMGCSGEESEPAGSPGENGVTQEVRSELARATPPLAAQQRAIDDLAQFTWSFYAGIASNDENFVYSPYSISVASAMLSAGAAGETLTQIQQALEFQETAAPLHEAQNALSLLLESRNHAATDEQDAQSLRVSNDFWMHPELSPSPQFLDTLAQNYGAGVHLAPFDTQPEACRHAINDKVSLDTGELIPELLPEGSIDPAVVFVLTNALYFKARWESEFSKAATAPAPFITAAGDSVDVATMRGDLDGGYVDGEGYVAVRLPYKGRELSMLIVVPDPGTFGSFLGSLTAEQMRAIASQVAGARLAVSLPKFEVAATLPLKDELQEAGMLDAFSETAADFPDIHPDVFISAAFHQARVIVDEEGTEAAAATAFVGSTTSIPPEPIEVNVDRPFIFVIEDQSGAVLFVGHVVDPR